MSSNCDELNFSRLARRTIAASPPRCSRVRLMKTLIYVNTPVAAAELKPRTKKKPLYGQTFTLPCTRAPGRDNSPLLPRSPNRVADVKRRVNGNVFRFRDVWSQTEADTQHFFPSERQQRRTEGAKEKKTTQKTICTDLVSLLWIHSPRKFCVESFPTPRTDRSRQKHLLLLRRVFIPCSLEDTASPASTFPTDCALTLQKKKGKGILSVLIIHV